MTPRLAAVCVLAALCIARVLAAEGPTLPVASDGRNLWVVTERMTPAGVERVLLHHAAAMGGAHAREVLVFTEVPEGMAAVDGALWIVFRPTDARRTRREVYGVRVWRHQPSGTFLYDPQGRMAIVPSLPGVGDFAGLVSIGNDPVAMLRAHAPTRLRPEGWVPLPGMSAGQALLPWQGGFAVVTCDEPFECLVASLDGKVSRTTIDLVPGSTVQAVAGADVPTILVRNPSGVQVLARIDGDQPHPLAVIEPAKSSWAVAGLDGVFVVLSADGTGSVAMRRIDPATGLPGAAVVLTPPPSSAVQWAPVMLNGVLVALVLVGGVLLVNPRRTPRDPAPAGYAPLSSARRGVALLIDLLPGVCAVWLMGHPLEALLLSPMASATIGGAVPGLTMIGIAIGVCVLVELATGASIGKWVVGGRVARMAPPGGRPAIWQVLVRNACKAGLLAAPVLVLFNAFTPGFRGVGELLSRTAVVDRMPVPMPLKPQSGKGR